MSAFIAENRRARFEYHIEETYEAGLVLQGWEVKAIRAGQVQLTDGYVVIKNGELHMIGCRINALRSASTHVNPEADRTKKLLMKGEEIRRLIEEAETTARTVLTDNLHELHRLAEALLEYETVNGEEAKRVIAGDDIGREDTSKGKAVPLIAGGSSIPKTKPRKPGSFGDPAPQGA